MPCPKPARAAYPRPCRGLLSAVAHPFQVGFCNYRTSNALQLTVKQFGPWSTRDDLHRASITLLSVDLLWPRLTSDVTDCSFRNCSLDESILTKHLVRSLRVRRVTFLPYTRRIYATAIRMSLDFESIGPLVLAITPHAIRVPQAGSLPAASFRFAVAHDTLAVRLEVPDIKASIGTFTQQVNSWIAFAHQLSSVNQDASRHA